MRVRQNLLANHARQARNDIIINIVVQCMRCDEYSYLWIAWTFMWSIYCPLKLRSSVSKCTTKWFSVVSGRFHFSLSLSQIALSIQLGNCNKYSDIKVFGCLNGKHRCAYDVFILVWQQSTGLEVWLRRERWRRAVRTTRDTTNMRICVLSYLSVFRYKKNLQVSIRKFLVILPQVGSCR